jgi:hypothetical protein
MDPQPTGTTFQVTLVLDLPNQDTLLTSGKTLTGKLTTGMVLQDNQQRQTRVLTLELLSPRDFRTGEVTITLQRTTPSPVHPGAILTSPT